MKKGQKKNKSPKAPYFQPLSYIDIIYNHKLNRELQVLSKVSFRQYWPKILDDLYRFLRDLGYKSFFVRDEKLVEYQENIEEDEVFFVCN